MSEINACNCPEPDMEPPEDMIVGHCSKCGGDIYQGEDTVTEDGETMCINCFRARVEELLREATDSVAECLGMRYERGTV